MSEEKKNNLEPETVEEAAAEAAEAIEEATEAAEPAEVVETEETEAVEEAAEEIAEEAADDAEIPEEVLETTEAVDEETAEIADDAEVAEADEIAEKKVSKGAVAAIIVLAVALIAVAVILIAQSDAFAGKLFRDKYSKMYVDITGTTAGDVAEQIGMEFEDFIEYYNLPKDVKPSTHEYAVINIMPTGTYIEKVMGTDYDTAKEFFGWDENVTEDTPIGEAWDKTPLTKYYGEAYVEQVKSEYNLSDDVTGETLYGEVREQIEKAMLEQRLADEAAAEEAEATEEAAATDAATEETAESVDAESAENAETEAE